MMIRSLALVIAAVSVFSAQAFAGHPKSGKVVCDIVGQSARIYYNASGLNHPEIDDADSALAAQREASRTDFKILWPESCKEDHCIRSIFEANDLFAYRARTIADLDDKRPYVDSVTIGCREGQQCNPLFFNYETKEGRGFVSYQRYADGQEYTFTVRNCRRAKKND